MQIIYKKVSQIVGKYFPKSEDYHLNGQVFDSRRSGTANIAEGFGRFHYRENIQFCTHLIGSLTETMDHMALRLTKNILIVFN